MDGEDLPNFETQAKGPFPGWGMPQVCAPDSALRAPGFEFGDASRASSGKEMPETPSGAAGTVLESFKRSLDVCNSPQYRHFHTATSYAYPQHPTGLLPLFTPGVHGNFPDIHAIITEQFDIEAPHDPTWEERPFDRLVWRGQTSGPQWDKGSAWISSQRSRLHLLSHAESGTTRIALAHPRTEIVQTVEVPNYRLNPLFFDTGMVGPPVQCIEADGTCDEMYEVYEGFDPRMSLDKANLYKCASRVSSGSLISQTRLTSTAVRLVA